MQVEAIDVFQALRDVSTWSDCTNPGYIPKNTQIGLVPEQTEGKKLSHLVAKAYLLPTKGSGTTIHFTAIDVT